MSLSLSSQTYAADFVLILYDPYYNIEEFAEAQYHCTAKLEKGKHMLKQAKKSNTITYGKKRKNVSLH